ncbi:IS30 family transposase, partial [Lacticaseibacillus paracasei]
TVDHGKEFSCDQALTKRYRIPVYFCHAYHPNERGTNERFNRERKCLRWQTPVQAVSKPLSRW